MQSLKAWKSSRQCHIFPTDCLGSERASATPSLPHTILHRDEQRMLMGAKQQLKGDERGTCSTACCCQLVVLSALQRRAPQHCLEKGGREGLTPTFGHPSPLPPPHHRCSRDSCLPPTLEPWLCRRRVFAHG